MVWIIFKVYLLHLVDTHRIEIAHKGLLQTWGLKLVKRIAPEVSSCCLLQLQLELRITWTFLRWKYTVLCQDKVGLRGQLLPCFVCVDGMRCIRRCYALNTEIWPGYWRQPTVGLAGNLCWFCGVKLQRCKNTIRNLDQRQVENAACEGQRWNTFILEHMFHWTMLYWKKSEPIMCNDVQFAWR